MRDRIIEVMARAHYEAANKAVVARHPYLNLTDTWESVGVAVRECTRAGMRAALTAYESHLQAEGMTVVPVEPTEAMLDNGGSSIIRPSIYMGGTPPGAKRRARDVWAAMLAAHTQEKDA